MYAHKNGKSPNAKCMQIECILIIHTQRWRWTRCERMGARCTVHGSFAFLSCCENANLFSLGWRWITKKWNKVTTSLAYKSERHVWRRPSAIFWTFGCGVWTRWIVMHRVCRRNSMLPSIIVLSDGRRVCIALNKTNAIIITVRADEWMVIASISRFWIPSNRRLRLFVRVGPMVTSCEGNEKKKSKSAKFEEYYGWAIEYCRRCHTCLSAPFPNVLTARYNTGSLHYYYWINSSRKLDLFIRNAHIAVSLSLLPFLFFLCSLHSSPSFRFEHANWWCSHVVHDLRLITIVLKIYDNFYSGRMCDISGGFFLSIFFHPSALMRVDLQV